MKSVPTWFHDGIRFECTQCGACCTGEPGAVYLTEADIQRLCQHLDLSRDHFLEQYTHRVHGRISLREKEHGDCIFLEEARCTLHAARPDQCRTYPFWPERMRSTAAWEQTCLECPGIGRGRLYTEEEILGILESDSTESTS